ncbi:hypothetical protein BC828DRAFT_57068 [Blastocladiella britannica]|nr:hypothetical protein BC828DRAFT_57068 [Blastocladiella britannica]
MAPRYTRLMFFYRCQICPAEIQALLSVFVPRVVGNRGRLYDLKARPWRYLPYMIHMNHVLGGLWSPLPSPLPLRTSFIPGHIRIDTDILLTLWQPAVVRTAVWMALTNIKIKNGKTTIRNAVATLKIGPVGAKQHLLFNNSITTNGFAANPGYVKDELYGKSRVQLLQMGAAADDYVDPFPSYITELSPLVLTALNNQPLRATLASATS